MSALTTRRIWLIGIVAISVSFVLATVAYADRVAFSSDDVAIQNIIQAVQSGQRFAPFTGLDNFGLKVPLYLLVAAVLPNGTAAIVVTLLVCNAVLLAAVLLAAHRITERLEASRRIVLAGALLLVWWFAAGQISELSSLMEPNGRNAEVGIALIVAVFLIDFLDGRSAAHRPRRPLVRLCLAAVGLGLLTFSDLFFLYVDVPTLLLVAGIAWLRATVSGRQLLVVVGTVLVGAVGGLALLQLVKMLGLTVATAPTVIVQPTNIVSYLAAAAGALVRNFHADIWGQTVAPGLLPAAAQAVLAVLCIALSIAAAAGVRRDPGLLRTLLITGIVVDFAADVVTSSAAVDTNFRYMLFGAICTLVLAVLGIADLAARASLRRAGAVAAVFAICCALFGAALNARTITQSATGALPDPQARTREIITIARAHDLTVGIGSYWDASVTSYFSGRTVRVAGATCTAAGVARYSWLVNLGDIRAQADRMFVVTSEQRGCTPARVRATYGTPDSIVLMKTGTDQIFIYDHRLP